MERDERGDPGKGLIPGAAERHIVKAQDELWIAALRLAAIVEFTVSQSVASLLLVRPELAAEVKERERDIDRREVEIERECLRILALYEPVASDFRRLLAIMQVNRDLERIGDLAARVAKGTRKLVGVVDRDSLPDSLERLAEGACAAVREALDALVKSDPEQARAVIAGDVRLDRDRRKVREELKGAILLEPQRLEGWLRLIDVARQLERIGDHAAGIAEAAIYLKEGQIIRHARGG